MSKAQKVLLIRLDKIGDLVSTLPVDQHPELQNSDGNSVNLQSNPVDVRWLIGAGLTNLVQNADPKRNFKEWPKKFSWQSLMALIHFLKTWKPDLVVSFHSAWWVNLALFYCRVPERAGPASQWHHFLFFNRRLKQKRSESIKHEADYNWELLRFALHDDLKVKKETPILKIEAPATAKLPESLLDSNRAIKKYYVIHAGMAGSALNWPQKNYIELAHRVIELGYNIVLTGTKLDLPYLTEVRPALEKNPLVIDLIEQLSFSDLLLVIKSSQGLLAPSTGVAHLGASLGVFTTSLFSPIPVQSTTRWAPRGLNSKTFSPNVKCPSHFHCLKENCNFYPCMQKISVDDVFNHIRAELSQPKK